MKLERWAIVGIAAVAVAGVAAVALATGGGGEESLRAAIRATARTSLALFLVVFVTSPINSLIGSALTKWMLRNRRWLGLSFAVSMLAHANAIAALATAHTESFLKNVSPVTLGGGGLGYVLLVLMTVTSFDGPTTWLGARRWKLLHQTGLWFAWVIFVFTYLPGVTKLPYAVFVALLVAGVGLRITAAVRRRARVRVVSPG